MSELLMSERHGGYHVQGDPLPVVRARSIRMSVALLLLGLHLTGCFHYVPVPQAVPPIGAEVSFGITDRGRVELTPVFGPGLQRVGGTLLEATDTSLVVSVAAVDYFDLGITARWAGERVEVDRGLITDLRERRLSPTRTAVLGGVITVVAVAVSFIGLRGFGREGPGERPDPGNGAQQ